MLPLFTVGAGIKAVCITDSQSQPYIKHMYMTLHFMEECFAVSRL